MKNVLDKTIIITCEESIGHHSHIILPNAYRKNK